MKPLEGLAWFVRRPKDLEALRALHPLDAERPYRVAAEVVLEDMDFQNFITDLYADRAFLEENAHFCGGDGVWSCLLVRCHGDRNGVLVLPMADGFVDWAAWTPVEA